MGEETDTDAVGARGPSQGTMMTGNSESEVAHMGERGAHPRQDKIGRVRRV
jgi:hypothetical protein